MTYGELNEQANRLANYLLNTYRPGANDLIGVCMERGLDTIVSILAILKVGAAYVPLDPHYPQDRLSYMCEHAGIRILLTHSHIAVINSSVVENKICIDHPDVINALATCSEKNLLDSGSFSSENTAYVIFTSGSTGKPKASLLKHRSLHNLMLGQIRGFHVLPTSRVLQFASLAFDAATSEIFMALGKGAALVLLPDAVLKSPPLLDAAIGQYTITHATLPPALLPHLQQTSWASVNTLIVAGEACPQKIADSWSVGRRFINAYGPSEVTVCATLGEYSYHNSALDIGTPLQNTRVYVLSDSGGICPIGVAGELYISGEGLSKGYLHQKALTQEKFLLNPFYNEIDHACYKHMYKTGDMVRWLSSGRLEFIGRIDQQVKIRGFRIELSEIETCIVQITQIKAACVTDITLDDGEKILAAFLVPSSLEADIDFLEQQVRDRIALNLPDYMQPSLIKWLEVLPVNLNGKIDKKQLPVIQFLPREKAFRAPQTELEKQIADVWQSVLKVDAVGLDDNFFTMGGHSLRVMHAISRFAEIGIYVEAQAFFNSKSLHDFCERIKASCETTSINLAPKNLIPFGCENITPKMLPLIDLTQTEIDLIAREISEGHSNIADIYPLAPLQEGILYHHRLDPESDPYVTSMLLRFDDASACEAFIAGMQAVMDRHDALRTQIHWKGLSQPVQVVLRQVTLPVTHLTCNQNVDIEAELKTRCTEKTTMAISYEPLVRLEVTQVTPSTQTDYCPCFVRLIFHHIVFDHVGLEIIQSEIAVHAAGHFSALPDVRQYREFVAHCQQQSSEQAKQYFTEKLGDYSLPALAFNLTEQVELNQPKLAHVRLQEDVYQKIHQLTTNQKMSEKPITAAAIFHAAWALVLAACSQQDDIVFGTVMSGRLQSAASAHAMLGLLINTLPIRVNTTQKNTLQFVQEISAELNTLTAYEATSLSTAQACSGVASGQTLFNAILNYRHTSSSVGSSVQPLAMTILSAHEGTNYPLSLTVDDFNDSYGLELQVVPPVDAERVLSYVCTVITALVESLTNEPEILIEDISCIPTAELMQLLYHWNGENRCSPVTATIPELFTNQATLHPDKIAVKDNQTQLSYRELEQQSNDLAAYLLQVRKIVPEELVGVCLERSCEAIVVLLAILKAGGAYLPLDPGYPQERLAHFVIDAQLQTIITRHEFSSILPVHAEQLFCLDDKQFALQGEHAIAAAVLSMRAGGLAYVNYTSGSTGVPKGVLVEQKSVISLVINNNFAALNTDTVMLHNSPLAFDAATFEIWGALLNGGKLIIQSQSFISLTELANFIRKHAVNTAWMTSGLFDQFAESLSTNLPDLRQLLFGGDVASPNSIRRMQQLHPDLVLINGYGPTENTTFSSSFKIFPKDEVRERIPIGKSLANRSTLVLDARQRLVPVGVTGELYVSGAGLARGYLNSSVLTDEKFLINPYAHSNSNGLSKRMYRTGDLVRWNNQGELEFIGRGDNQVKIRGFRIELGEIESALLKDPQIREAVVLAKGTGAGDKRVVGYLVPADDSCLASQEPQQEFIDGIKQSLTQRLPDYMVPGTLILLAKFPLNANGKVDRKALPEPDAQLSRDYVAPVSATEKTLCDLWQNLLHVERIGVTDNFFNLGGHSLLAMKLITHIENTFGISMNVKTLFQFSDIQGLAVYLDVFTPQSGKSNNQDNALNYSEQMETFEL